MVPEPVEVERFRSELDALIAPDARLGIAVSGGPDSLALLLLAACARPGMIKAATVDHDLREGSRAEAEMVAGVCSTLGVPHAILSVEWADRPETAIQERARRERYCLLVNWAETHELAALLTAHHLDDQAETLAMRLSRGAGVRGLGGMRTVAIVPGGSAALIRPLLGWRHSELVEICLSAGLDPVADPSNEDEQFERIRVRRALAQDPILKPQALATSAAHLAEADAALEWATDQEWARAVVRSAGRVIYRPTDAPSEIRRRIVIRAISSLAIEGRDRQPRGAEIDRVLAVLVKGGRSTLRGVCCDGGLEWAFAPSRVRKSRRKPDPT